MPPTLRAFSKSACGNFGPPEPAHYCLTRTGEARQRKHDESRSNGHGDPFLCHEELPVSRTINGAAHENAFSLRGKTKITWYLKFARQNRRRGA